MKILIVCASIEVSWGGPPLSALRIGEQLVASGHQVKVVAPEPRKGEATVPTTLDVELLPRSPLALLWKGHGWRSRKRVRDLIAQHDIVHIHEIWHYLQFVAAGECQSAGVPYVVTLHGAVAKNALDHRRLKKIVFWSRMQRPILQNASAIHALSDSEKEDARNSNITGEVHVVPNGVAVDTKNSTEVPDEIEKLFPELTGKFVILFLGRIHPIKRLDVLCQAFVIVNKRSELSNLHLVIAGPDETNGVSELQSILERSKPAPSYSFTGPLTANVASQLMKRADIYAQVSESEGSSMSILEAAAAGTPMVITTGCNFADAETLRLGTIVEPDADSVANGLNEFVDKVNAGHVISDESINAFIHKYSIEHTTKMIETMYHSAVSRQSS